jgi:hypothetical protein
MKVLPPLERRLFSLRRYLPPGTHQCAWEDFVRRFGWGSRRAHLLTGLQALAQVLKAAGCEEVRIGGSFVTTKPEPSDYDLVCMVNERLDKSVLPWYLAEAFRLMVRDEYGGDFFYSNCVIKSCFFSPEVSPCQFFARTRFWRKIGIVALKLDEIPAPEKFVPGSFGPLTFVPGDW